MLKGRLPKLILKFTVYSKETNTTYINVINRHKDKAITTNIVSNSAEFTGKAEATLVAGNALNETFTYDKQNQYVPVTKEFKAEKNKFTYSFPAHSFTQIKVRMKK